MIALLGGTFDPIHVGHVAAAHEARRRLGLDSVRFVVARQPYHKPLDSGADALQRLQMVELACAGEAGLVADDSEIQSGDEGPSYTVDLLERRTRMDPGERRCWIIGSDAFALIRSWRRVDDVFRLTNFLVFHRAGAALPDDSVLMEFLVQKRVDELDPARHGQVVIVQAELPAVSSSEIRSRIRSGSAVDACLSPRVLDYIRKHHLYEKTVPHEAH